MLIGNPKDATDETTLDFFSDAYWVNPYPLLHRLRARSAAVKNTLGIWEFLRYNEVESLFRDSRILSPGTGLLEAQGIAEGYFFEWWRLLMFQNEGDTHRRLRRIGATLITRDALNWTRTRANQVANEILDSFAASGRIDILVDYAHIIPIMVICDLIGIPPGNYKQIAAWSDDVAIGLSMFIDQSSVRRIDVAVAGLCSTALAALHNTVPRANSSPILSALRRAIADGSATEPEIVALASNLLYAGHLTTKNLIGNGMLALLRNPEQKEKLRQDPGLIVSAIEEFLRYDAPVSGAVRQVSEPFWIGDIHLQANELIYLSVLGANRDPDRFAEPDCLDIKRADNKHLSFGWGSHLCLGAPFARAEATAAISTLLERCQEVELDAPSLSWRKLTRMHGLESLPVRFVHM